MDKGIIFVDDEENILNGLRRSLRKMRKEWRMEFAISGEEALDKLSRNNFSVIVTDMRMPGMDGAELLRQVHEKYPQMIRIVLSGQCEEEAIIRAVVHTHFFLSKPCNAERLQSVLNERCSFIDGIGSEKARRLSLGLLRVPILNRSIESIKDLAAKGDEDLEKYIEVVSSDPMLAAKILHLVHSQFFVTIDGPVGIRRAVELVTARVIAKLVTETEIFSSVDDPPEDPPGVERAVSELASHMVKSEEIARTITKVEGISDEEASLVYMSALVHDIGRFVILKEKDRDYTDLLSAWGSPLVEAEKERFGFSHAEVGALILNSWGFPDEVTSAIKLHDSSLENESSQSRASAIVRLANLLERGFREGDPARYVSDAKEKCLSESGIKKSMKELLGVVAQHYEECALA